MPIQKTDRNTTWILDQSNTTWTLAKNARINVTDDNGIHEAGQSGNEIKVLGDIVVKGGYAGVRFSGTDSSVMIGKDASVNAKQADHGIFSEGAGSDIINRGLIRSGGDGIHGAIWNDVENYGTIRANTGLDFIGSGSQIYNYGLIDTTNNAISSPGSGTYIENAKGATIRSDGVAISLTGTGVSEVVNKGVLRGETYAMESGNGETEITNTGKIFGNVYLGGADDIFDSRKGELHGTVFGGDGDDDYVIGQTSMKIREDNEMDSGFDQVKSIVNYKLSDNVEELTLIGTRDIDATGNSQANFLYGNNADNKFSGLGGDDLIRGNGGDDILAGGAGHDTFVFALTGHGVDRITDFEDGLDLIAIETINTQQEFDALNIKQLQGGDLLINLGGGDKIIIEDLLKSDFTYLDDIAT